MVPDEQAILRAAAEVRQAERFLGYREQESSEANAAARDAEMAVVASRERVREAWASLRALLQPPPADVPHAGKAAVVTPDGGAS